LKTGRSKKKKLEGSNYKLRGANFFIKIINIYEERAFSCGGPGPCQPPFFHHCLKMMGLGKWRVGFCKKGCQFEKKRI